MAVRFGSGWIGVDEAKANRLIQIETLSKKPGTKPGFFMPGE
jgi:hypothetical protein